MPSYLREPSGSACWNCDQPANETVVVALRTPTGGAATFRLCRSCYDSAVPRAAALGAAAGIEVARGTSGRRGAS